MRRTVGMVALALAIVGAPAAPATARGGAGTTGAGSGTPATARADLQATRAYYERIIREPSRDLAALLLFMTLMPKGGDLHHHYAGSIDAERYVDWVGEAGACVWIAAVPARGAARFTVWTEPTALTPAERADCLDADALRADEHEDDYRALLAAWTTTDFGYFPDQVVPPDMDFFQTFPRFGGISGADDAAGFADLKARALDENVQYIETIIGRPAAGMDAGLGAAVDALDPSADRGAVRAVLTPLYDFLATDEWTAAAVADYVRALEAASAGIDDDEFTLRFQMYVVRNDAPSAVFAGLYSSFAAAAASDRIVGVNLVGPENRPVSMRDYPLHMEMIAFLRERFPGVHVALHAGELVPGLVPTEGLRDHIRLAVEVAGADRIGHGIDIPRERDAPGLLREMRARDVAVEVTLTSNELILGVSDDAHPVRLYDHAGVPVVIATDDAGVTRTDLSGEYMRYASRYLPSYDAIKATVMDSIRYSFLTDEEKAANLAQLGERFRVFEARIADLARGLPGPAAP